MKKALFTFILLIAVLVAGNATADMIDGTIGFVGTYLPTGDVYETTGDLSDATGVAFPDNLMVVCPTGDFSSVFGSAVFNGFTFVPGSVAPLWTVGGFSFNLNTIEIKEKNDFFIELKGAGVLYGNGFEETNGTWNFWGTSGCNITFSFSTADSSDSSTPGGCSIPDPSVMVLLGSACLIGFVGTKRKRG